jgi:hypothetical protein
MPSQKKQSQEQSQARKHRVVNRRVIDQFTRNEIQAALQELIDNKLLCEKPDCVSLNKLNRDQLVHYADPCLMPNLYQIIIRNQEQKAANKPVLTNEQQELIRQLDEFSGTLLMNVLKQLQITITNIHSMDKEEKMIKILLSGRAAEVVAIATEITQKKKAEEDAAKAAAAPTPVPVAVAVPAPTEAAPVESAADSTVETVAETDAMVVEPATDSTSATDTPVAQETTTVPEQSEAEEETEPVEEEETVTITATPAPKARASAKPKAKSAPAKPKSKAVAKVQKSKLPIVKPKSKVQKSKLPISKSKTKSKVSKAKTVAKSKRPASRAAVKSKKAVTKRQKRQ